MVEANTFPMARGDLMKLNLHTVSFEADAMRDAERSKVIGQGIVLDNRSGLVDSGWHKLSSTTALRFADLEGLPSE